MIIRKVIDNILLFSLIPTWQEAKTLAAPNHRKIRQSISPQSNYLLLLLFLWSGDLNQGEKYKPMKATCYNLDLNIVDSYQWCTRWIIYKLSIMTT